MEHTPGPWKWDGIDLDGPNYEPVMRPSVSCGQWCQGGAVHSPMSEADRTLIEAAPDMLKALRRAVLALAFAAESSAAMRDDYEAVSAAIAKATGSAS